MNRIIKKYITNDRLIDQAIPRKLKITNIRVRPIKLAMTTKHDIRLHHNMYMLDKLAHRLNS